MVPDVGWSVYMRERLVIDTLCWRDAICGYKGQTISMIWVEGETVKTEHSFSRNFLQSWKLLKLNKGIFFERNRKQWVFAACYLSCTFHYSHCRKPYLYTQWFSSLSMYKVDLETICLHLGPALYWQPGTRLYDSCVTWGRGQSYFCLPYKKRGWCFLPSHYPGFMEHENCNMIFIISVNHSQVAL